MPHRAVAVGFPRRFRDRPREGAEADSLPQVGARRPRPERPGTAAPLAATIIGNRTPIFSRTIHSPPPLFVTLDALWP